MPLLAVGGADAEDRFVAGNSSQGDAHENVAKVRQVVRQSDDDLGDGLELRDFTDELDLQRVDDVICVLRLGGQNRGVFAGPQSDVGGKQREARSLIRAEVVLRREREGARQERHRVEGDGAPCIPFREQHGGRDRRQDEVVILVIDSSLAGDLSHVINRVHLHFYPTGTGENAVEERYLLAVVEERPVRRVPDRLPLVVYARKLTVPAAQFADINRCRVFINNRVH